MGSSLLEYPSFSSEASTKRDVLFQPGGAQTQMFFRGKGKKGNDKKQGNVA